MSEILYQAGSRQRRADAAKRTASAALAQNRTSAYGDPATGAAATPIGLRTFSAGSQPCGGSELTGLGTRRRCDRRLRYSGRIRLAECQSRVGSFIFAGMCRISWRCARDKHGSRECDCPSDQEYELHDLRYAHED